ncbi:MAG: TIGR03936 family radical SAM-associated protein [Clostridiales bacterium]|nr:TIGR03936 family radical SAM-associated protein [Clostridiales bacterium]
MSNYILKYARDERVKYISHLDFIRTFHRTVRRAGLEMSFSQGYNPHPIMTVAMPLSVGVTSGCEYMKIGFEGDYDDKEIKDRLNGALPEGFSILEVCKTEGKQHDFARLDRAVYLVEMEGNCDRFDENVFLANFELKIMKKSKSGEKESDIRPYIYDFSVLKRSPEKMLLKMCIAAGNSYNLKVESVKDAMEKYSDGFKSDFFCVHREKILAGNDELL